MYIKKKHINYFPVFVEVMSSEWLEENVHRMILNILSPQCKQKYSKKRSSSKIDM